MVRQEMVETVAKANAGVVLLNLPQNVAVQTGKLDDADCRSRGAPHLLPHHPPDHIGVALVERLVVALLVPSVQAAAGRQPVVKVLRHR